MSIMRLAGSAAVAAAATTATTAATTAQTHAHTAAMAQSSWWRGPRDRKFPVGLVAKKIHAPAMEMSPETR